MSKNTKHQTADFNTKEAKIEYIHRLYLTQTIALVLTVEVEQSFSF